MDKKRALLVVFVILSPFFLALLSYQLLFHFTSYLPAQQPVINFLGDKEGLNLNLTSSELSHLEDVKRVMNNLNHFFYFLLLSYIFIIFYFYNLKDKKFLKKLFLYSGISTFILIIFFFFFILTDFNFVFTLFHQLFFPQGNWLFPPESFLIQLFPLDFFLSFLQKTLFLALFWASLFILGSLFLGKNKK